MNNNFKLYTIIILLLTLQAGLFIYLNVNKNIIVEGEELRVEEFAVHENLEDLPKHYSYFSSLDFFEESFTKVGDDFFEIDKKVYGGIIPHHLVVKDNIASFFLGLEKDKYERIILIGPNHFEKGDSNIISSQAIWQTPYGELEPDLELLGKLNLEIDEAPFIEEHSISGLVSFIKKTQSQAKFIPIILKVETSEKESGDLARSILENVDVDKTLVIASVDFSHYLPVAPADFHDTASRRIIESFDFDRIKTMEIDSPASIHALLSYLKLIEAQDASLLASTNSGRMMNDFDSPTTSHNIYYFSKGTASKEENISLMFFGDLMIDRYVNDRIQVNGFDYLFTKLKGDENRFFRGIDLIGANLEGAVTNEGEHFPPTMIYDFAFDVEEIKSLQKYNFNFFNLANNHFSDQGERGIIETRESLDELGFFYVGCQDKQVADCSAKALDVADLKIGMAGFSMVYGLFDIGLATSSVAELANQGDLVVVNIHWGVEYEHYANQVQKNIAHSLIDAGADVIIGHHPHVVQGLEIYKNRPIFYSLGNFIFDQYFSRDTQIGLGLGINFNEEELDVNLFPLILENSQPSLMGGRSRQYELDSIIKWSDLSEEYAGQVKIGKLNFIF